MSDGWQTLGSVEQTAQPNQPVFNQSTGLREAREAIGLHIAVLAAALKVPVKKLEALEAGRYDELPDMTFARALASSACRHLKIDSAQVLERFPQAQSSTLGVAQVSMNTTFQPEQSLSTVGLSDALKKPAVWITLLVLIGALGVAFLPDWSQWPGKEWLNNSTRWVQDLARSEPKDEAALSDPATPISAEPEMASPAAPSDQSSGSENASAPLKLDMSANATSSSEGASSDKVLHLEAVSDSWIEVVDGAGKVQVQRVLKKGDTLDFSSTPPYSIVLGRADAVRVSVRGQAFDVAPFARNSVARFQVK